MCGLQMLKCVAMCQKTHSIMIPNKYVYFVMRILTYIGKQDGLSIVEIVLSLTI